MKILETSSYAIKIGAITCALKEYLSSNRFARIVVLVDGNTKRDCLPLISDCLSKECEFVTISAGEKYKNIDTCQKIWSQMINMQIGRDALLINLGGGVIGDMGGFCAATYKRGIRFIQIPTTLLSQVDASVGGKLGIDFLSVKNAVGVFQNPECVFIDPVFLNTLPKREIRSGFAEIVKHALIADAHVWQSLCQETDIFQINWENLIHRSVATKKEIVETDPFEKGIRKALNFGHTIGHAIESVFLNKTSHLLHGEAIAIGMICEAFIAHEILNLPTQSLKDISTFLVKIYGKVVLDENDFEEMLQIMANDKKNIGATINFSLIPKIGQVAINQEASSEMIVESLVYYQNL